MGLTLERYSAHILKKSGSLLCGLSLVSFCRLRNLIFSKGDTVLFRKYFDQGHVVNHMIQKINELPMERGSHRKHGLLRSDDGTEFEVAVSGWGFAEFFRIVSISSRAASFEVSKSKLRCRLS